jgi:copper(I)-binding protein
VIRPRLAVLGIAGALTIAPALAGCGAGTHPETTRPTQLTQGVNADIPTDLSKPTQIKIRNLFVLGPADTKALDTGSSAPVYGTLIDSGGQPDKLISVSSPAFGGTSKIRGGGIALAPGQAVQLSALAPEASPTPTPAAGKHGAKATATPTAAVPAAPEPAVVLTGLTERKFGGEPISLTLQFERAGSITVTVLVVPQTGEYLSYSPAAAPAPAPVTTVTPLVFTKVPAPGKKAKKATKATPTPTP